MSWRGGGGRGEVLRLYRAILRRGDRLRLTDRHFFRKTVRLEFRKSSRDTEPQAVARNVEVNTPPQPFLCF